MYLPTHMLGSESCAANYDDQALLRQMQAVHQFILNVTTLKYLKSFKTLKEPDPQFIKENKIILIFMLLQTSIL